MRAADAVRGSGRDKPNGPRPTPGPWASQKDTGPAASGTPEWWVYADAAQHKLVAICQGPDAKANAALIVAAHDAVAACAAMLQAADELMTEFISKKRAADWGIINGAMVDAARTIAKAGGA